ncbi:hypothetical protein WA1_12970 [Scytonema hofmannii PCC 7110]|uniref:Uncharacterized protein n=1 Tax=Scytonema hofmannii PCC 7110 TaxID=128403 RepID=A0A139XE80_9CYAN|nr:tetratricopeptide repeat protein [Scytonema hofmannii]KYC43009.1 hypothetical protein WA1_12970 [Scytonema hofmannii PCC 7110]
MKCPVCGAVYRPIKGGGESPLLSTASSSPSCRRCKADLSDLFRLHDQAIWYHKQALHLLTQGRYPEAVAHNNQALALYYSNADFHALAGKLSALQGEFREAISSWQQALKFDPQNVIACNCLHTIELMAKNYYT